MCKSPIVSGDQTKISSGTKIKRKKKNVQFRKKDKMVREFEERLFRSGIFHHTRTLVCLPRVFEFQNYLSFFSKLYFFFAPLFRFNLEIFDRVFFLMFLEKDQGNPGRNVGAKNSSAGAEGEIRIPYTVTWVIHSEYYSCTTCSFRQHSQYFSSMECSVLPADALKQDANVSVIVPAVIFQCLVVVMCELERLLE